MFVRNPKLEIVISQPDLESALNHLNSMPHTATKELPRNWGIKQVKEWLIGEMPCDLNYGDSFEFGTGLWGHVKPLGYEFYGYNSSESRLQILVSERAVQTDLNNLITIKKNL